MRFLLFTALLIDLFLLNSCKKHVPSDAAFFFKPTVVSVATTSTPVNQGSGSHKITDLWVYVNGKFQGAYPTGNLIPIITKDQSVKLNIFAGINNNGIGSTRLSWIFYDYLTIDTLVESGKTIERPLTFHYNQFTKFNWMENFDSQGFTLVRSIGDVNSYYNSDTTWRFAAPEDCYEGKSAEIGIISNGTTKVAQVESSTTYTMPLGSANVYLEFNYKCTQGFEVGVLYGNTTKSTIFVNPSANWNKIYISLADAVNRDPKSSAQKIYFKMVSTSDNPNPKMFLDNIKMVTL